MKIELMIIKKIKLLIIIFIVLLQNQILASDIDINNMTLKEALEYSQSGNPIDAIIDYCKENNLYGADTFAEKFGDGEWANVKLGNKDTINKTIESGVEALEEKHKDEQKEKIYVESDNQIYTYIILVIFIMLLLISILKKKRIFVILSGISSIVIIVLIITNFIKISEKNNLYDNTLKLLNNINENKAEENLNLDKEINISRTINDYIIKVWYCAKCKAENIDIFDNDMVNGNHVDDEPIIFYDDCVDVDKNYVDKWEYYGKKTVSDWTGRDYPIQRAGISKETTKIIFDKLTDKDLENYKNGTLIDKLVNELKNKIKYRECFDKMFEKETLSDYIAIIAQGSSCYFSKDIEDEVKRNYKYWYLDGENKTIELPYGVYLKYEKQEVEKIDNAKWIYTNINEIYYTDDEFLYAYYLKDDKLYGNYASTYIENKKISFNPYELTYKIKKAKISLSSNKNFMFNDKNPLKESDMWRFDDKTINMVEFTVNNADTNKKTCGTERDLSLIACLIDGRELYKIYICSNNFNNKYSEYANRILQYRPNDYNNVFVSIDINKPDKMLRKIILENDAQIYFLFKVKWVDGMVDDIEMYEIPEEYNNLPPDEMYQLAFND